MRLILFQTKMPTHIQQIFIASQTLTKFIDDIKSDTDKTTQTLCEENNKTLCEVNEQPSFEKDKGVENKSETLFSNFSLYLLNN